MNHFFESFDSSKISLKNLHIQFYQYTQMNGHLLSRIIEHKTDHDIKR
jgi:hypothetical protein